MVVMIPVVIIPVDITDQHAERSSRVHLRRRNPFQDHFNQWLNTTPIITVEISDKITLLCAPIKNWGFELVFGGSKLDQQFKNTILHSQGISRFTINLVNHNDRENSLRQRLSENKPGLSLGALKRINDQ